MQCSASGHYLRSRLKLVTSQQRVINVKSLDSVGAKGRPVLDCPSAQANWPESAVLGVVGGTVAEPRVAFLDELLPVTDELLGQTAPVQPTEVLRVKSRCIEARCAHYKHRECTLVSRILVALRPVADDSPACKIRSSCRWFYQAGTAACLRCPQVVTSYAGPSRELQDLSVAGETTS